MNETPDICNELESLAGLTARTSAYIRQLEAELAATKNSLVHAYIELQALKTNPAGNNTSIESSELLNKFNETVAFSLAGPGVPEINPGLCFPDLLKASRNVLSWIEAKHRPPINDFCGGMALVRLHALADLKAAVDKIDQK